MRFDFKGYFLFSVLLAGCATSSGVRDIAKSSVPDEVEVVLLHMNDIYEVTPLQEGKVGGLARVATIKKELLKRNPNTFALLAGDFVSPSAIGTAKVDGKRLAGKQMISTLNTMGLDLAVFGNHEFDLKKEEIDARIQERKFHWISGNVTDSNGDAYLKLPQTHLEEFKIAGTTVRVGFVSATINSNKKDFVQYEDPITSLKKQVASFNPRPDAIVAVTHLDIETDKKIAQTVKGIDLIVGGHEHDRTFVKIGKKIVPIAKADANAKSVYIHVLRVRPNGGGVTVDSHYRLVNDSVSEDSETAKVAADWTERAFDGFRKDGFEPPAKIGTLPVALDGITEKIRKAPTQLTRLICDAILSAAPDAKASVYNSGGIRIDDVIPAGPITEYDVIRMVPFPDILAKVEIRGSKLKQLMNESESKKGTGGYLLSSGISKHKGKWVIQGQAIQDEEFYPIMTVEFLTKEFASEDIRGPIVSLGDLRKAVVRYIREKFGE